MILIILIFYLVADKNFELVIFIDYYMVEQQNIKKNIFINGIKKILCIYIGIYVKNHKKYDQILLICQE